jgi:tRNA nucleotidyltransferase (CCA-adding enzyme)
MAKRAHAYPHAELEALDLVDVAIAPAPAAITVADALARARRRNAGLLAAGAAYVLRDDLVRAASLGLGGLRAAEVARALPVVDPGAGEATVRRLLAGGAPLVAVRGPSGSAGPPGPAGAISGRRAGLALADASAAGRLNRGLSAETRELLTTIGRIAEEHGDRAFLVGGLVRDLWRRTLIERRDLDLVVEGDGPDLARRLARAIGGSVVEHRRFLTASIETRALGRIDVTTSRSERYESPGALPRVMPAGIREDLRRRDFTVNAMAIELSSGAFGLIDPLGGRLDLTRRCLRALHPLSFVEDPTRMFRAARYAVRLGLAYDRATVRAQALALRLAPYPALSGQRIATEIERVLDEEQAGAILTRLGRSGAFRLLDPGYRFTAGSRRRLGELSQALAWARARSLDVDAVGLTALALVGDQPSAIAAAAFTWLGFAGGPAAVLGRAHARGGALVRELGRATTPSERARRLRGSPPVELAWYWLLGNPDVRRMIDWFVSLDPRVVSLSGDDVVALGVPRGPAVAQVLAEVRDARLDGTVASRAMEEEHVRQWLARGG